MEKSLKELIEDYLIATDQSLITLCDELKRRGIEVPQSPRMEENSNRIQTKRVTQNEPK